MKSLGPIEWGVDVGVVVVGAVVLVVLVSLSSCSYSCCFRKAQVISQNMLPGWLQQAVRVTSSMNSLGPIEWIVARSRLS